MGTLDLDVLKDSDFLCGSRKSSWQLRRARSSTGTCSTDGFSCCFRARQGVVSSGEHGEAETALRFLRRHYITRDNLVRAIKGS